MSNEYTLEKANDFIQNNKVKSSFYPKFNFAAPIGWMNDPNGVSIFNDEIHLFYQHYPYDSVHGKMHWGHAKSQDGIEWEHLNVALAPDQPYDKDGVFSGSAIEKDGKLYLMYTGHVVNDEGEIRETQNIAISEDGINFEKSEKNPVLDEKDVPAGSSIVDFRDPKVFEREGKYYAVIGSKTEDQKGQALLYVSKDLIEWDFQSVILPHNKYLGDMVECPDLLFFEESDVFLLSAMNYTDEETGEFYPHISWIIEGKVDWTTFVFEVHSIKKMDGGFDFYAPQTSLVSKNPNEYMAIAWQQAWNRTLPSHDLNHKWAGQMTIPRLIQKQEDKIIQKPYPSIENNLEIIEKIENLHLASSWNRKFTEDYLEFEIDSSQELKVVLSNQANERLILNINGPQQKISFNRRNTMKIEDQKGRLFEEIIYPIPTNKSSWKIKCFVDNSSMQVFINDDYTLTSTFYTHEPLDELSLNSENQTVLRYLKIGKLKMKTEKQGE